MRLLLTLILSFSLVACKGSGDNEVLAVVNGKNVTLKDVKDKNPEFESSLFKLREAEHNMKKTFLERTIEEALFEMEAKERNISTEALREAEITSKLTKSTDKDVDAFAQERGIDKKQIQEVGYEKVKEFLDMQKEKLYMNMFISNLKNKYKVDIKLQEPAKPKVNVEISDADPSKGNKNAKVTVVEFSEFECPFCKKSSKNLTSLIQEYGDKIRVVFKHFPLSFHKNAYRASEASMCANEQDKFFEYHDVLFENNTALSDNDFVKYASDLGLNVDKFKDCLSSGKYKAKIDKDMEDAQRYGISGVPSYFINGELISGAVPYSEIKKKVDSFL